MSFLTFQIASLFYILLLAIIYFSKNRIKNTDNRIFAILIVINLIGVVSDIMSTALAIYDFNNALLNPISKVYLIYMVSWLLLFTIYVVLISDERIKLTSKPNLLRITILGYMILVGVISYIPLYNHSANGEIYTYGPAVTLTYVFAGVCSLIWLISIIINRKSLKNKKYIPLLSFAIVGLIAGAMQLFVPEVLIITFVLVFINFLMYFTLENPDIKMLEEFKIAKDRAEKANKEKEIFLYNVTNDIRIPLTNIKKSSSWINENLDEIGKNDIKEGMHYINNNASMVLDKVNNVLDITNMEITNIKVYNTKYNIRLVLDELYKLYSNKVDEDVKLNFNIDSNIPEYLNGDSLRLKQLLTIILDNSVKYTNKGYIELNLNTIIKKGVCRLIISLDDTGIGIKASDIENIFNKNNQNYNSIDKIDDSKKNLAIAKSIATLLGGILLLESEIGKGTTITFVLDQKIYEEKSDSLVKIENDITSYISKKKVMVISEDIDYLEILVKKLSKYDIDVIKMNLASYGLEHVRLNKECDLIIMDEELKHLSSLEILNKFKMIPNFNIDIAILTNNPSNNYIEDGFTYVLNRKLDTKELDSLIDGIE